MLTIYQIGVAERAIRDNLHVSYHALLDDLCAQARANAQGEAVAWALIQDGGKILEFRNIAPGADIIAYMKEHNNAQWKPLYAHTMPDSLPDDDLINKVSDDAVRKNGLSLIHVLERDGEFNGLNLSSLCSIAIRGYIDALRAHMGRK